MSRSRPLNVYVIGCEQGPQKIGVSDNLTSRVTNLQTGRSDRLSVAFSEPRPFGDARLIERTAHALLSAKRAGGEWFTVSLDEAIEAVRVAICMVEAGEVQPQPPRAPQNNVIGVRFGPAEHEALGRAATADALSMSGLARKIINEWLRANGYHTEDVGVSSSLRKQPKKREG